MWDNLQIALGIAAVIVAYGLTRKINAWRIKRAYESILRELEQKKAFDPPSATKLPYARQSIIRAGMKDFRPKAVEYLVAADIVGKTGEGKYYLKDREAVRSGPE